MENFELTIKREKHFFLLQRVKLECEVLVCGWTDVWQMDLGPSQTVNALMILRPKLLNNEKSSFCATCSAKTGISVPLPDRGQCHGERWRLLLVVLLKFRCS